jgi:hypothetical protein
MEQKSLHHDLCNGEMEETRCDINRHVGHMHVQRVGDRSDPSLIVNLISHIPRREESTIEPIAFRAKKKSYRLLRTRALRSLGSNSTENSLETFLMGN